MAKTPKTKTAPPIDETLRAALRATGETDYALGKRAGVSPGMIARFVSGERDLRLATAARLAGALGLALVPTDAPPGTPSRPAKRKTREG